MWWSNPTGVRGGDGDAGGVQHHSIACGGAAAAAGTWRGHVRGAALHTMEKRGCCCRDRVSDSCC